MVEEVALFVRSAVYGTVIGVIYWFLTYEVAGTILLVGMGLATVVVATALWFGLDRRWRRASGANAAPDRPFQDEEGRIPAPTVVPLALALGVALAMLGLVFTPALTITGTILALIAAREWLRSAVAESAASD
jgi:cytochrome c oxidase subunit IV